MRGRDKWQCDKLLDYELMTKKFPSEIVADQTERSQRRILIARRGDSIFSALTNDGIIYRDMTSPE